MPRQTLLIFKKKSLVLCVDTGLKDVGRSVHRQTVGYRSQSLTCVLTEPHSLSHIFLIWFAHFHSSYLGIVRFHYGISSFFLFPVEFMATTHTFMAAKTPFPLCILCWSYLYTEFIWYIKNRGKCLSSTGLSSG